LILPKVVYSRVGEFVLKETLMVVPGLFQLRAADRIDAVFGRLGQQSKVESFNRLAALFGKLGADSAFILHPTNLMAAGAPIGADEPGTPIFSRSIVHEGCVRIPRLDVLTTNQECRYVTGVLISEPEVGHYGHILNLKLVSIIRTLGMIRVKDKRQPLLCIVFGRQVSLFSRTIRSAALARVMHPAHYVIVVRLLAQSGQIGCKGPADPA